MRLEQFSDLRCLRGIDGIAAGVDETVGIGVMSQQQFDHLPVATPRRACAARAAAHAPRRGECGPAPAAPRARAAATAAAPGRTGEWGLAPGGPAPLTRRALGGGGGNRRGPPPWPARACGGGGERK